MGYRQALPEGRRDFVPPGTTYFCRRAKGGIPWPQGSGIPPPIVGETSAPHFLFRKDLARRPVSEANRRESGGPWAGDKRAAAGPKENFWPVRIVLTTQPGFASAFAVTSPLPASGPAPSVSLGAAWVGVGRPCRKGGGVSRLRTRPTFVARQK